MNKIMKKPIALLLAAATACSLTATVLAAENEEEATPAPPPADAEVLAAGTYITSTEIDGLVRIGAISADRFEDYTAPTREEIRNQRITVALVSELIRQNNIELPDDIYETIDAIWYPVLGEPEAEEAADDDQQESAGTTTPTAEETAAAAETPNAGNTLLNQVMEASGMGVEGYIAYAKETAAFELKVGILINRYYGGSEEDLRAAVLGKMRSGELSIAAMGEGFGYRYDLPYGGVNLLVYTP